MENNSTLARPNLHSIPKIHQQILNAIVYANVQNMNLSNHVPEVAFINNEHVDVYDINNVNNNTLNEGGVTTTIGEGNLSCYEIRY